MSRIGPGTRILHVFLALGLGTAVFSAAGSVSHAQDNGGVRWPGADLFTNGAVSQIRIELAPDALAKLRREPRQFVPATVVEPGAVYREVGVHLKGSVGSFRPLDDKPALTLDFAEFRPHQRFHGLRRIHLNNSVEDRSYCNEALGSGMFRAAGIPAPRVSRAVVLLNGRRLGLYVLKEGFTEEFLSCYFRRAGGNLFEPGEGHDVNQRLKRAALSSPGHGRAGLKALADAAREPDLERRWDRLEKTLALDSFIRFMALEVMICHRDGYCLARNNYRVYQDVETGKILFFPHGMDQLFGSADLPWKPHLAGLVARAVLETPQGSQQYAREFRTLFGTLFEPIRLTNEVDRLFAALAPFAEPAELDSLKAETAAVKKRIVARHQQLEQQLAAVPVPLLDLANGSCPLSGWVEVDPPPGGRMDRDRGAGRAPCLHIAAAAETAASWRTKARLQSGHYRFEGNVRVAGVKPLDFGAHQGAGLRVAGQTRQSPDLTTDPGWHLLTERFEVGPAGGEVEFICEFRAGGGEAWFDLASLRVVREP